MFNANKKFLCLLIIWSCSSMSMEGSNYLNYFPDECLNASSKKALPGHILRLGFLASTSDEGMLFFFPDSPIAQNLDKVHLADNAGELKVQNQEDSDEVFRQATPRGSYVVAQIFIGDASIAPVVTCLSDAIPLSLFDKQGYGKDLAWLTPQLLGKWLSWRDYNPSWNWQKRWSARFQEIRDDFHDWMGMDRSSWRGRYRRDRARPYRKNPRPQ